MTVKEKLEARLGTVREQAAKLQEKQKALERELRMAEDAEKMKFIEKNKISMEMLRLLNKVNEEDIRKLLRMRSERENEEEGRIGKKEGGGEEGGAGGDFGKEGFSEVGGD